MFLYCIFIYVFAQIVNGGTCHYFNANTFCCVEVITVPCHWLFVPILFCNDVSMRLEQQFCWILAQNKLPLLLFLLSEVEVNED